MAWSFDKHTPVYLQIADRIRSGIISGEYPPDSQIPSVRQLALVTAVNPNTVQHALVELENEQLLYSRGTAGRFVTGDPVLLDTVRRQEAKKLVRGFIRQAEQMSITKSDLIAMIEEETV